MKIYVDCGTNHFKYFQQFYVDNDDYDQYHLFEPDKELYEHILERLSTFSGKEKVFLYNKAVWTKNGQVNFFNSRFVRPPKQDKHYDTPIFIEKEGSTIIEGKLSGNVNYDNPISVECIDLYEFITKLNADSIYLKMDIEGAEYDILETFLEKGYPNNIDILKVEFHHDRFESNKFEKRHFKLKEKLINENKQT